MIKVLIQCIVYGVIVIVGLIFLGLIFEFIQVTGNSLKVNWHHLNKKNPKDKDLGA